MKSVEGAAYQSDDKDIDYAFGINQALEEKKVLVTMGGIDLRMIIDSGATVNLVDRKLWEEMKLKKIVCDSSKQKKSLFAYGSEKPLTVAGCFTANVQLQDKNVLSEFVVTEEKGQPLLRRQMASVLGILTIERTDVISRVEGND